VEYTSAKEDENERSAAARQTFRESVREVYPELLRSLRQQMLPIFRNIVTPNDHTKDPSPNVAYEEPHDLSRAIRKGLAHPRFAGLREPFIKWARTFNIEDEDWFIRDLLSTLRGWVQHSKHREDLQMFSAMTSGWAHVSDDESRLQFEHSGWTPTLEKWRTFKDRISVDFQEALRRYEARMRSLVESRGCILVPPKKDAPEYFDWLVLWQIAGQSQKEIVDWHLDRTGKAFDEVRIRQGIKEAATMIGLKKLRRGQRGPTRKPKLLR